jgi:hypothetical protein
MKTYPRSLFVAFVLICFCGASNGDDTQMKPQGWKSPNKINIIKLIPAKEGQRQPPNISLNSEVNGRSIPIKESPFIESPIMREYAGTTWLQNTAPRWVDNRYAVFEDPNRAICIIDTETGSMLLNTTFEAIAGSPEPNVWAAIRYRPTSRRQERLNGDENDTLFIIDLSKLVERSKAVQDGEKRLFGHLKSTSLPGVALARPLWVGDGNSRTVVVAIWDWAKKKAEALSLDSKTLVVKSMVDMDLTVPDKVAYSPWIDREFEPKVLEALRKLPVPVDDGH